MTVSVTGKGNENRLSHEKLPTGTFFFFFKHGIGIQNTNVTVHEKTTYIGHFGGNEALTDLISMQTAK